MYSRRKGRDVNGIILLNKPLNQTSNQALMEVKRLFNAKKAGHTGSLDPLATGMLPICFGEATKFSQFLLEADKQYLVEAKLGIRTTTGDAEGEVISEKEVSIAEVPLVEILAHYVGEIEQIPSMYSAIKFQGRPLYSYARQGIEIERKARRVFIHELNLMHFAEDRFKVLVRCSKGTYIRTLIDDIGEALGVGAFVTSLHRSYVEPYDNKNMLTIDELKQLKEDDEAALDEKLLPVDSALGNWPEVTVTSAISFYLKQGQPVIVPYAPTQGWVRIFSEQGPFLGLGEVLSDGRIAPRRLVHCARIL